MKVIYNPGAIAKIFSALSQGKITEDEFMDAQTPEQVDELLKRGGIHPAVASRVFDTYSRFEGSLNDGIMAMEQDDTIGPKPRL